MWWTVLDCSCLKYNLQISNQLHLRFWNCCAVYLVRRIPKPSMRASRIPPIMAEPIIVNGPPGKKNKINWIRLVDLMWSGTLCFMGFLLLRAARMAPVSAPLVIEFQGSSFPLRRTKPQSIVEKSPPQTAKLPEKTNRNKQVSVCKAGFSSKQRNNWSLPKI